MFNTPVWLQGENWYLRTVLTQSADEDTPISIIMRLVAGQELLLTHLRIQVNDITAGAVVVKAQIFDEDNAAIRTLISSSMDNQVADLGKATNIEDAVVSPTTDGTIGWPHEWFILHRPDQLRIIAADLKDADFLTVTGRGRFLSVGNELPTLTTVGTNVVLADDYHKAV